MADIQQAAKWIQEGKHARRPNFGSGYFLTKDANDYLIATSHAGKRRKAQLTTDDLLADDWEPVR